MLLPQPHLLLASPRTHCLFPSSGFNQIRLKAAAVSISLFSLPHRHLLLVLPPTHCLHLFASITSDPKLQQYPFHYFLYLNLIFCWFYHLHTVSISLLQSLQTHNCSSIHYMIFHTSISSFHCLHFASSLLLLLIATINWLIIQPLFRGSGWL